LEPSLGRFLLGKHPNDGGSFQELDPWCIGFGFPFHEELDADALGGWRVAMVRHIEGMNKTHNETDRGMDMLLDYWENTTEASGDEWRNPISEPHWPMGYLLLRCMRKNFP
jgi:hypothetical protein